MENVLEKNEIGEDAVGGETMKGLVLEDLCDTGMNPERVNGALSAMDAFVSSGSLNDEEREEVAAGIRDTAGLSASSAATEIASDVLAKLLPDEGVVVLPELSHVNGGWVYRVVKRAFDVVSCSCALVLLSPVMAYVAARIKLESPGPVLYAQVREGVDGKPFKLYKFRSMYTDAEARGAQWAAGDDPRITPFGHVLRKSRLDEVPQFWNVVRGDMSLVGPRPERPVFCREFEKRIEGWSRRTAVRPGITGLAQVEGGYDLLPKEKAAIDIRYIETRSLGLDLKIMLRTLGVLKTGEGAR